MKKLAVFVLALLLISAFAPTTEAKTLKQIKDEITSLSKKIQTLSQQAQALTAVGSTPPQVMPTTSAVTCTNWKVTEGGPQGGTYWENIRDFSKHPEIDQYQIQWFNGNWSNWYTSGVDDLDTKVNDNKSWRYMIAYKQDHNWRTRDCVGVSTTTTTPTPSITVVYPNGGETFTAGQQITVKWTTKDYTQPTVDIRLSLPNFNENGYSLLVGTPNDGEETVTLPTEAIWLKTFPQNPPLSMPIGKHYKIWIDNNGNGRPFPSNNNFGDDSDNFFTINGSTETTNCTASTKPWINVLSPRGGEVFDLNEVVSVKWITCNIPTDTMMVIHLVDTRNGSGGSFYGFTNDGQENIVPNKGGLQPVPLGSFYKMRVSAPSVNTFPFSGGDFPEAFSNNNFTITNSKINPSVTVLYPNGGEMYKPGDQVTIRWKTNNFSYNPGTQIDIMDDRISDWTLYSLFGTEPALKGATLVSSNGTEYVYEYKFIVPAKGSLPSKYDHIVFGGFHYSVKITIADKGSDGTYYRVTDDSSDKLFSINNTGSTIPTYPIPTVNIAPTPVSMPTVVSTTTPTLVLPKTLRPGLKNDDYVKSLQQKLRLLGYFQGAEDGNYGNVTRQAVQRFQQAKNVNSDGFVGKTTWALINVSTTGTSGTTSATLCPNGMTLVSNCMSLPTTTTTTTTIPSANLYSSTTGLSILNINGNKSNYSPNADIELSAKTANGFGSPAMSADGYHIQSYVFPASDTGFTGNYMIQNPEDNTNAKYESYSDTWKIKLNAPTVAGSYNLRVTLYCSKENSKCWNSSNKGAESVKILPFTVGGGAVTVSGCTSANGYSATIGQACGGVATTIPTTVKPSITITSPNGGETYTAGQQITVKWKTENVPPTATVIIGIDRYMEGPYPVNGINPTPQNQVFGEYTTPTPNDGSEVYTIPGKGSGLEDIIIASSKYKVSAVVFTGGNISNLERIAEDKSDNFLTINTVTSTTTTTGTSTTNTCADAYIVSGTPVGGTHWEEQQLNTTNHPEIKKYRIQWFNGNWSPWYIPGIGDLDSKTNYNGTQRLLWSYFQDHTYQTCKE